MEVRIKYNNGYVDADWAIEDDVMVVSPKVVKFEPKDGDVCVHDGMIYIFKGVKPSSICSGKSAIIHHCYYDVETLQVKEDVGCGYIDCSQRFATEEEKKLLFDKLKEEGYEWDAEKKEVVKIKWKPSYNGEYYFKPRLDMGQFIAHNAKWLNDEADNAYDKKGWIFKTNKECQEFCYKLNQAIEEVKP